MVIFHIRICKKISYPRNPVIFSADDWGVGPYGLKNKSKSSDSIKKERNGIIFHLRQDVVRTRFALQKNKNNFKGREAWVHPMGEKVP